MATKVSRKLLSNYIEENSGKSGLSREIAALLIDAGQTSELDSLMRDVNRLRSEKSGVVEVNAISAFPISDEVRREIENVARRIYPSLTELVVHEKLDKSVIGGVNLTFADSNLDLTLKRKLQKLRDAAA